MFGRESLLKFISSALDEAQMQDVCARCRLRLAGVKDSREHLAVGKRQVEDCPPAKRPRTEDSGDSCDAPDPSGQPCRACLGVLQDEFMRDAMGKVGASMRDGGFDADHFTVAVSLPVSLALRSHSLNVFLNEKVDDIFDADDVVPIKQVWKWLFPSSLKSVGRRYVTGDDCEFYVDLDIVFSNDQEEIEKLKEMCKKEYAMRQKKKNVYHMGLVTRVGAEKSLAGVADAKFRQHYPVPPEPVTDRFISAVKMHHNSIYVAGRYNKYSRELPQTPWVVDGEKKMETSVEDLILDRMKQFFAFDHAKFSSSGREDIDVRCLGRGRPFMFEVVNPRKTKFTGDLSLSKLQSRINASSGGRVRVRDMQVVPKSEIKKLKEGEDQKTKVYRALCVLPEGDLSVAEIKARLDPLKDLELSQRTPVRVMHRRPNNVRQRTVYWMEVLPLSSPPPKDEPCDEAPSPTLFLLRLATQAGTYVKEFVHGDFLRTRPSVRSLLGGGRQVDIAALDVEAIDLDWPTRIDPDDDDVKPVANGEAA